VKHLGRFGIAFATAIFFAFVGGVLVVLAGPLFAPIPERCQQPCDGPAMVRLGAAVFIGLPGGFAAGAMLGYRLALRWLPSN
jgi:hypothetical protein